MAEGSAATIVVHNASSVLDDTEFAAIVEALNEQATEQYNECPWVKDGYSTAVESVTAEDLEQGVPEGAWVIELLDTSDQEGALGYHEDLAFQKGTPEGLPEKASDHSSRGVALHPESKAEIPVAKVFCKTSQEDGVSACEVASHEMLEMLVDPDVLDESKIRKYLDKETHQWYIGEVCDAVQDTSYKASNGQLLANYVLPAYYGQEQQGFPADQFDYGKALKAPFSLAPGGYMSVSPEKEPTQWTQIFGAAHSG